MGDYQIYLGGGGQFGRKRLPPPTAIKSEAHPPEHMKLRVNATTSAMNKNNKEKKMHVKI